jgi:hypothetical protein
MLAAELGTGPDQALMRAIGFYRKFIRRGRRIGRAPEEFLRELLEAHAQRDIQAELAKLREKLAALVDATPAKKPPRPKEPTALEVYLMAKGRMPRPEARPPVAEPADGSSAITSRSASPPERAAIRDGSPLAGLVATCAAPQAAPAAIVPAPAPAAPQAKSDYADRRMRLPKITF